jgi:hypothetical protein
MEDDDSNKRTSKSEHQDGSDKDESKEKLIRTQKTENDDGQSTADPTAFGRGGRSNKIAPIAISPTQ